MTNTNSPKTIEVLLPLSSPFAFRRKRGQRPFTHTFFHATGFCRNFPDISSFGQRFQGLYSEPWSSPDSATLG